MTKEMIKTKYASMRQDWSVQQERSNNKQTSHCDRSRVPPVTSACCDDNKFMYTSKDIAAASKQDWSVQDQETRYK